MEAKLREETALNVIVNVSNTCVLNCAYCFNHDERLKRQGIMEEELLEEVVYAAFKTRHKTVEFEWTGGEPLLAPAHFYDKVILLQRKFATKPCTNTIQTTVPPYSQALICTLLRQGYTVSTTIDGPKAIHSRIRGEKSYDRAWEMVTQSGGRIGYIITATRDHLTHEREIFDQASEAKLYSFHCNPCLGDSEFALDAKDYLAFFLALFNEWIDRGMEEPKPYTLEYMMKSLVNRVEPRQSLCTFGGRCLTNFVSVTPHGDLYPCPKFAGIDGFKLGNIMDLSIEDAISPQNPPMARILDARRAAMETCSQCRYYPYLNGCCPYESYLAGGLDKRSCLCEGKQGLFAYGEAMTAYLKDSLGLA